MDSTTGAAAQSKASMQSRFGKKLAAPAHGQNSPEAVVALAAPEEGTELIRAFLRIERRDVRAAIVELVLRLSM